jgi:hypothetical protein
MFLIMKFKACVNNSALVRYNSFMYCVCVRACVCVFRKESCFVTNNHEADVSRTSYNYPLSALWRTLNLLPVLLQLILNTATSLR